MALYNQAYDFILMTSTGGDGAGNYSIGTGTLNALSGAPVYSIYCVSAGSITIGSASSSSKATLTMTAGQSVNILVGSATVTSGSYMGIMPKAEYFYP